MNKDTKKWQVFLPEPFIINNKIKDSELLSKILNVESENDLPSLFSSAMQTPEEGYTVVCSFDDLVEALTTDNENYYIELEMYDDLYIINVNDLDGNFIGRGEISELNEEISLTKLKERFERKLDNFQNNYNEGIKRMNNFAYTLKDLTNKIKG